MTNEEARDLAIRFGALEPRGMVERIAAGLQAADGGSFSESDVAQARLESWTEAILQGRNPRNGRPL